MRERIEASTPRGQSRAVIEPVTDPEILEGHLRDASGEVGQASALFRPGNEVEIAEILRRAAEQNEGVTVVAEQSSTTGSSVPRGGWILSTERMNRVLEIDVASARARAEAGVVLGELQRQVDALGLLYPPDPTSRFECSLGGSVACNASGPRSFYYGATRRWVRGLRVVLACGEVLDVERGALRTGEGGSFEIVHRHCARARRGGGEWIVRVPTLASNLASDVKSAAGYTTGSDFDLIDLFIGSEGTLGVVSEIEVGLDTAPKGWLNLLAFFADEDHAIGVVERLRESESRSAGLHPQSLEYFDAASLDLLREKRPGFALPSSARAALVIEQVESGDTEADAAVSTAWFTLLEREAVHEVVVAQTAEQRDEIRVLRHEVPAAVNERAQRNRMPKLGTDLSVRDATLREMLNAYRAAARDPQSLLSSIELQELAEEIGSAVMPDSLDAVLFGHIGDNHLHMNFLPRAPEALALARCVRDALTRMAIERGGSPSAEHGIGKIKHAALRQLVGDDGIERMRAIKRALDPDGILGRDNLFPASDRRPFFEGNA